jgi:hypothetical protein
VFIGDIPINWDSQLGNPYPKGYLRDYRLSHRPLMPNKLPITTHRKSVPLRYAFNIGTFYTYYEHSPFRALPLTEFVAFLFILAQNIRLAWFRKHPRGPKKPRLKHSYDPKHPCLYRSSYCRSEVNAVFKGLVSVGLPLFQQQRRAIIKDQVDQQKPRGVFDSINGQRSIIF